MTKKSEPAPVGRPKKNPDSKKIKIAITVDPDLYDHIRELDNISGWINDAGRAKMDDESPAVVA